MADWEFWKGFVSGAIGASFVFFTFAKGIVAIKSLWPKRAKPEILEFIECTIDHIGDVSIKLLIRNSGSKDCSLIDVDLDLPKLQPWSKNSTLLPKLIAFGTTELIEVLARTKRGTTSGEIKLKFDVAKPIRKIISFNILKR